MADDNSVWSIEELVALTDEVQKGEVEFRGKSFVFQYCELSEGEEPKFKPIADNATEEAKNDFYSKVGGARIVAMIEKANDKNPDGATLTGETWAALPSTLRYSITAEILNISGIGIENFPSG